MEIHDRIRELRVKAGFTQSDIASYLHTDVSYYSKYERGLHPIPVRHLKSLCELYHVSADYILDLPILYDGKKNNALRRFLSSILNKTLILFKMICPLFFDCVPRCLTGFIYATCSPAEWASTLGSTSESFLTYSLTSFQFPSASSRSRASKAE